MSGQITLLDLRSKEPCQAWSPNTWKTRLLLNYKGLDYKTEWIDYPDIKPRLEPHLPPNTTGFPYTVPTVILADGIWVTDSVKIAHAIEQQHPSPPMRLSSPYQDRIDALTLEVLKSVLPIIFTRVPKQILPAPSIEYWHTTRSGMIGMPLDEFEAKMGGEAVYQAAAKPLAEITAMLKENPDGPFLEGKNLIYADIVWVTFLDFMKKLGSDAYGELLKRTGDEQVHVNLLDACAPWLKRDD